MRNKEQNEKNNKQNSSTTKIILVVVIILLISLLVRCAVSCQQRKMVNEMEDFVTEFEENVDAITEIEDAMRQEAVNAAVEEGMMHVNFSTKAYFDGKTSTKFNIRQLYECFEISITAQNDDEEVDVYLTVIEDVEHVEDFFTYRDRRTKKKYELTNEGIILTEKTADMLGVKVGDKILLSEDGKNEKKVEITAICENYASHFAYMTSELYEKLYGEALVCNNLLIKSEVEVGKLEKIGEEILKFDDILNVQYTANLSSQLDDMLGALDQVMIVLIIVAGMLSFVVLYNLNNINITERRRELATLKVLGFYDIEVANYVYRENILLTILGAICGCGIGKFLHLFTIKTVEVDVAMFGREISLTSYVICALITCGFSAFVNWIMYFKLKKINMVESLKSVE